MEALKRWCSNFLLQANLDESVEEEDRLARKPEISFPSEIIVEILSRLPVKSILQFRSVSKPWLSLISDPSFTIVGHRTAFFITAYDTSACKLFFLSATHDSGSVTHLMTTNRPDTAIEAQHVNGLVCCTFWEGFVNSDEPFVFNPSTHKVIKLHDPSVRLNNFWYYFGFDESRNEHKVLRVPSVQGGSIDIQKIMIFNMSNYSWREIDATSDISPTLDFSVSFIKSSVCVNGVIYMLLLMMFNILAFDLRTEKFSIVEVPLCDESSYLNKIVFSNYELPCLIKINDRVGVVCYDCIEEGEIHIWILQDYQNHVWVKETITIPKAWHTSGYSFPMDSINAEEIIFSVRKLSSNVIGVPMCNMKNRCFKTIQFTLDHPFLRKPSVKFHQIKCYVESMLPLPKDLMIPQVELDTCLMGIIGLGV
ncbi:putative F-box domain-containing protein [Helianthus debilis subsp. tardiflorus]